VNLSANCCSRAIIQTREDSMPANPASPGIRLFPVLYNHVANAGVQMESGKIRSSIRASTG